MLSRSDLPATTRGGGAGGGGRRNRPTTSADARQAPARRHSLGDPSSSPDEDAEAALREFLADASFTNDPLGVQVGTLDGVDVAFVMTQVNPTTGWSRITYMGVAPSHRRRGLGAVVHARGIAVARTLGGRLYVGGTSTANAPMLALFRRLGAQPLRAMERWALALHSTA